MDCRWTRRAGVSTQLVVLYSAGFFMVAIPGPVITALQDVVQSALRSASTGATVTCNNPAGMALGPLVIGVLSDTLGLRQALLIVSFVPLLAMAAFLLAVPMYQHALRDGVV